MHREEGIIDEADLGVVLGTYLCDTACLHRYHLFFLEIIYRSIFLPSRQGHCGQATRSQGLVCRNLSLTVR